jgi:hypothetical protein
MLIPMRIFKEEFALKDQGRCPFCKQHVPADSFRDTLSATEFLISGLCQSCQDVTFGKGDGNET